VADYNANGGLWSYSNPIDLLDAFDRLGEWNECKTKT
jgi:hypothetical protein